MTLAKGRTEKTKTRKKQTTQEDGKSQDQRQELERDITQTYNAFKEFEGKRYTGVRVGRGHKWNYDSGEWKERKVTPDKWEFTYAVPKHRVGKAPEGSGVPVGTEYHWYILAHQAVRKLNANDYTTAMTGMKYKLAHKRAGAEKWSAGDKAQRRHLIKILEEMIAELKEEEAAPERPLEETEEPQPVIVLADRRDGRRRAGERNEAARAKAA